MKMRRKGFLAALAGMVASPLLAKVKMEPPFPRYFAFQRGSLAYVRVDAEDWIVLVRYDGTQERAVRKKGVTQHGRYWPAGPCTMQNIRLALAEGLIREITAAEAKTLLKPKFPRYFVHDPDNDPWFLINESVATLSAYGQVAYVRADAPSDAVFPAVFAMWHDSTVHALVWTIQDLEQCVADGTWREITAAEAQALLKPKVVAIEDLDDVMMRLWARRDLTTMPTDDSRFAKMVRQMMTKP